jgi:hypothetical protein
MIGVERVVQSIEGEHPVVERGGIRGVTLDDREIVKLLNICLSYKETYGIDDGNGQLLLLRLLTLCNQFELLRCPTSLRLPFA